MKLIVKNVVKEKLCGSCGLKETCGDTPGLCMMASYAQIATVVVMLSYFLVTMNLTDKEKITVDG